MQPHKNRALQFLTSRVLGSISTEIKLLIALWISFGVLVALGIHGSSIGIATALWSPDTPYTGYLLKPPRVLTDHLAKEKVQLLQELTMSASRGIRSDEWLTFTPYSLSQVSHKPAFPVVNTNIAGGQNMLVWMWQYPVWHVSALARPATWGYFALGGHHGLAWYWWFQAYACFTALYLLLVVILRGHKVLAAFGSFWFCSSAYVVCWSLWPAHITFFSALGCLCAYHLLASQKRSVVAVSSVLLGLCAAGFFMFLYPAWQVSLGYLSLFIFAGLFARDKLYRSFTTMWKYRLVAIVVSLAIAGALIGSYVVTCLPDLKLMANTAWPGKRASSGGDYEFALLFKGMYNLIGIYHDWILIYRQSAPYFVNQSETASFYHLFPAAFLAIAFSKHIGRMVGILGWLLVFYIAAAVGFMLVGIPQAVARVSLLSYVPAPRMDLSLGLSSIVLCTQVLAAKSDDRKKFRLLKSETVPILGGVVIGALFLLHGLTVTRVAGGYVSFPFALAVALLAGIASFFLISGRKKLFCGFTGTIVLVTSAFFNPLATNLSSIYDTELAQQIIKVNQHLNDHPLWLCYGNIHSDTLIVTLGGRALAGAQWPPQLSLWSKFDPTGRYKEVYNKYAQIHLRYDGEANPVSLINTGVDRFEVHISPNDPILKQMGARYVLAFDHYQQDLNPAKLIPTYKSSTGRFTIFEIPRQEDEE